MRFAIVQPLSILQKPTFFVVPMVGNGLFPMMQFKMLSFPLRKTQGFMFCVNKPMSFAHSFKSFRLWVDIVLSVPWQTWSLLIPIQVVMVFQVASFCRVATMVAAQVKEGFYHNWHSENVFLPLAIEVFGCLHQQANNFLHQCAIMVWLTKDTCGPPLVVLCAFYKQRVSVAL